MQILMQSLGNSLPPSLAAHIRKRIHLTLGGFKDNVLKVLVRLSDVNGPRGGIDKRCLIQVKLSGQKDVVIEDTQNKTFTAVNRAAHRAKKGVVRRITQSRHRANRKHKRLNSLEAEEPTRGEEKL